LSVGSSPTRNASERAAPETGSLDPGPARSSHLDDPVSGFTPLEDGRLLEEPAERLPTREPGSGRGAEGAATTPEKPVSLKSFFSDTAVFGLVDVIDKSIGLALMFVLTYLMVPADYGVLNIYGATLQILSLSAALGIQTTFFRFHTEAPNDDERRRMLSTALWFALTNSLLVLTAFVLLTPWLAPLLFGESGSAAGWLCICVAIASFLDIATSMGVSRLQADGMTRRFFVIEVIAILTIRVTGFGLIVAGYGFWGWILGQIFGQIIHAGLMFVYAFDGWGRTFDGPLARRMYLFGWSLMPMALSHWVMRGSDKYMINGLAADPIEGKRQVGFYSIGERISSIMDFVGMAFNLGWRRFAYKNIHHPDGPGLMARGMTLFSLIGGYVCIGLTLLGDDLMHWVLNRDYSPGLDVIPMLTLGSLCWGLSNIVETALYTGNRVHRLAIINIVASLLNVVMNRLFIPGVPALGIPAWGIFGAGLATFLGQFLKFLLVWRMSYATKPIPYEFRRLALIATVLTGTLVVGGLFHPAWLGRLVGSENGGWLISTLIQGTLLAAVPPLFWFLPFLFPEERLMLRAGLDRLRSRVTGSAAG
jgi:O-antigen/teichoic acid export membrane protein